MSKVSIYDLILECVEIFIFTLLSRIQTLNKFIANAACFRLFKHLKCDYKHAISSKIKP